MPINNNHPHGFLIELAHINRVLDAGIIWFSLYGLRSYFQIEPINQQLYVLPALLAIIFYFLVAELFSLYPLFQLTSFK